MKERALAPAGIDHELLARSTGPSISRLMKKAGAAGILFFVFLAIPLIVNLWKFAGRGYTLYEIWPHLLLDAAVMALFFFLLVSRPLENPVVYGALFGLFCVAFLLQHTPDGIIEWIATLAVLAAFGSLVFPRLTHLLPHVLLGLLISYYGILRTYLPELNRTEVLDVLEKKSPGETAREFIRTVAGYSQNAIGREKYRYFLTSGDDFTARLRKAGALHAHLKPALESQGIAFLEWEKVRTSSSPEGTVVFLETVIPCRLVEKDESGLALHGTARVQGFAVQLQASEDGSYRVADFPDKIEISLVQKTVPQF